MPSGFSPVQLLGSEEEIRYRGLSGFQRDRAAGARLLIDDVADVGVAVSFPGAETGAIDQLNGIGDRIVAAVPTEYRGLGRDIDFGAAACRCVDQVDRCFMLHLLRGV